jgi:hypothetical protein
MRSAAIASITCIFWANSAAADEQTQKMTARLSEEAEAFRRAATQVLGTEKLHQNAMKPPARFRPRVGTAPPAWQWKERNITSEYGFASLAGQSGAIHELRQVVSVDGRRVEESKKAQAALAKAITASDDDRKKDAMKQLEKHGLTGGATDFGQLLLLFGRREVEQYEFEFSGRTNLAGTPALVFSYKQLDGPEALTVFDRREQAQRVPLRGEIRVRENDFLPMQITLVMHAGDGSDALHEQAVVTYAMSPFGVLLPVSVDHRESRGGKLVAENEFTYSDFHKFSASTDVKFDTKEAK